MPSDDSAPPYALEVTPESALQFTLTRTPAADSSSSDAGVTRCTMTLRHPGKTKEHLAFKVKTTQPRRYLVRPNQGLVAPNSTETVSILLVEKDKQVLLQSYDRLGQSALDHSKDKFLVQSCAAPDEFASLLSKEKKADQGPDGQKTSKEMAEKLTSLWEKASSSGEVPVYNKKLHVRHVVTETKLTTTSVSRSQPPAAIDKTPVENMSQEQMFSEVSSLRRKYDELVAFSVNLTAERDILNNTLEQTKRDLNRETAAKKALQDATSGQADRTRAFSPGGDTGGFSLSLVQVLVVGLACFLAGIKACNSDSVNFLQYIPVLGSMLGMVGNDDVPDGAADALVADSIPAMEG